MLLFFFFQMSVSGSVGQSVIVSDFRDSYCIYRACYQNKILVGVHYSCLLMSFKDIFEVWVGGNPTSNSFGHFPLYCCSLISTSKFSFTKTAPSTSSSYSAQDAEPGQGNLVTNSSRRRCCAKLCLIYFCHNPTKLKRTTSPETLRFDVKHFPTGTVFSYLSLLLKTNMLTIYVFLSSLLIGIQFHTFQGTLAFLASLQL